MENALVKPPKFIAEEDLPILRGLWLDRSRGYPGSFGLQGTTGAAILEKLIATGRAFASPGASIMHSGKPCVLHPGPSRRGQIAWQSQPDARVRPVLQTEPPATMLLTTTQPCWYVDPQLGEAGTVDMPWPAEELAECLAMPSISLDEVALVGSVLREVAPDFPLPPAHNVSAVRVIDTVLVPVLALNTLPTYGSGWMSDAANMLDFATVSFDYAGVSIDAQSNATLVRTQFDFLLPGFLGTRKDFSQRWRTPIEKGGDTVRRDLLARRIRPFMLRRRKDEVVTELPPKTTIERTVELEGAQRDLYETVRAAMQEKVRAAVTAKGLARSHIVVLEALLKLRQVCCDPRLVKISQAPRIKESAKLTLLLEMLPELIEEGRRILLFSQFTGMLELIAAALNEVGIPYVVLSGDTTDRRTPIKRFQQGAVPLFLISLKAGGVGLNLTAADIVIHYDPWWNPAVENQATDRAHRLGQNKPVFVYKLITAGSVEEKIVAMQEQKAALADAILSEDAAGAVKFSADDLDALFEPIPSVLQAAEPRKGKRLGNC